MDIFDDIYGNLNYGQQGMNVLGNQGMSGPDAPDGQHVPRGALRPLRRRLHLYERDRRPADEHDGHVAQDGHDVPDGYDGHAWRPADGHDVWLRRPQLLRTLVGPRLPAAAPWIRGALAAAGGPLPSWLWPVPSPAAPVPPSAAAAAPVPPTAAAAAPVPSTAAAGRSGVKSLRVA